MSGEVTGRSRSDEVDRLGAVASGACAAHCAVCAFLPSALGALGLGALLGHEAEWAFTLVAVVLASFALLFGRGKHVSWWISSILAIGIVGLLLARVVEESSGHPIGTAVGIVAGVALVAGHLFSLRASRRSQIERA